MRIKEIYNNEGIIHMPREAITNTDFGEIHVTNMRIIFKGRETESVINLEEVTKFSMDFGIPNQEKLLIEKKNGQTQTFLIPRASPPMAKNLDAIRKKFIKYILNYARERETALDYSSALKIWEDLGEIKEAARVRKLSAKMGSVKVSQKVVHGDEVTEIKDSVLNRSNVGGSTSKMQELKDLAEMKKEGLIDDDEFKQMKKEILGK